MQLLKIQKPFALTIFGASGDLAKLKIFPSLYSLMEQRRLPQEFYIIGYARSEKTQKQFRKEFEQSIRKKHGKDVQEKLLKKLLDNVHYFSGKYDKLKSYIEYKDFLKSINGGKPMIELAYLSVPPTVFKHIIENLGESRDSKNDDIRLIIEKPFGKNCKSAQELFHFIARYFNEEQVYLLDHYLGKSAVQSILNLRHYNHILNMLLKGPEIANIQITAIEDFGVDNRIGYFDEVGTIKDMFQSHLLQLLALVAMSIPMSENATSVHREKNSILSALKFTPSKENIVLGQYEGYKKLEGVKRGSKTDTFVALKLGIDRETWFNTPIYLRTGKQLHKKQTAIVVEFKKSHFQKKQEQGNTLIIEIYPKEKLNIRLLDKNGVSQEDYKLIETSQSIACTGDDCLPEHATLMLDAMRGRKMYFLSFPEIIAAWDITERICEFTRKAKLKPQKYKNGLYGPTAQDKLTKQDGFKWHQI